MLQSLTIKNIALIDELTIELGNGFNVLTGETGAGKSLIIDSLALLLGEKAETFLGLCGVGDLIVTCSNEHSRNFQAGFEIGQKNSAVEYMKHITKTVEGIHATTVVYDVMIQDGLDMPLTNEAYQVLYQGKKPSDAILDLMNRSLKDEGATPSV